MTFPGHLARSLAALVACAVLALSLLCAATGVHAGTADPHPSDCPPPPGTPSEADLRQGLQHAANHGFLWRIRRDGRTSYLYGTLHVARFEWMFPGSALAQALRDVDTVALELDLRDPDIAQRLQLGLRTASAAALPAPLLLRLQAQQRAACVPEQSMTGFSPELQVDALTTLAGRRDGLEPTFGIDNYLANWAHAAGKSVVSLETPELQMQTLRMPSADQTLEFVDASLRELESGAARSTLLRLAAAWADSDLATLSGYASWCDCMNTPQDRTEMARLVDDRNPAMAQAIAQLHASGKQVLAAVGSLHMIGPQGLPAQLARVGFVVERVQP